MTVIEHIHTEAEARAKYGNYKRDTLTLTFEDRRQGHGKRRSDGGVEFAISLATGTILKGGDCMVLEAEQTVVKVQEAPEAVYIVRPITPQQWAFYAYHVGNRHQQVMIGETELIFLQNPAVRSVLEQLHVHFETDTRPFTAALATVGHSH
jgi:urease accessory protein UreE